MTRWHQIFQLLLQTVKYNFLISRTRKFTPFGKMTWNWNQQIKKLQIKFISNSETAKCLSNNFYTVALMNTADLQRPRKLSPVEKREDDLKLEPIKKIKSNLSHTASCQWVFSHTESRAGLFSGLTLVLHGVMTSCSSEIMSVCPVFGLN